MIKMNKVGLILKFFALSLFLLLISINYSCQKDKEIIDKNYKSDSNRESLKYKWSNNEKRFFNKSNSMDSRGSQNRDSQVKIILREPILELYRHLASTNQVNHFIEDVVGKVGVPLWNNSYIYLNESKNQELILLPFKKAEEQNISAILSAYKKENGEYVLNAVNREFLINNQSNSRDDTQTISRKKEIQGLRNIISYDEFLFSHIDNDLIDKYCLLLTNPDVTGTPPNTTSCSITYLEGCDDLLTGGFFWGGLSNAPPHLDHDGDGILNDDDRDFQHILSTYGISKEQFLDWIYRKWQHYFKEDYGSYEDFWSDYDNWEDWDDTDWEDIQNDFYDDWDDDYDEDGGGSDDPIDPKDEDPLNLHPDPDAPRPGQEGTKDYGCYLDGGFTTTNSSGSREDANCTWYLVVECSDGTNTWVEEIIEDGDPNNQHGQDSEYEKQLLNKVRTFTDLYQFGSVFNFYDLANGMPCSPFAPQSDFNKCMLSAMFNNMVNTYPNILPTEDVFGTNKVYLENNPNIMYDIMSFLNDHAPDIASEEVIEYFIFQLKKGVKLEDLISQWDYMNSSNDTPFEPEPSDIEIVSSYVPDFPPNDDDKFSETEDRQGHEYDPPGIVPQDLQYGTDGNPFHLSSWPYDNRQLIDKTDTEILLEFNELLHASYFNKDLQNVATEYYNRFENSTGGDYYNEDLSTYVLTNGHTIATVQDWGELLNRKLKTTNGDISSVTNMISIGKNYRAVYREGERSSGLEILVRDTEKLIVYSMNDYSYDATTKEWEGTFYFQIIDNFGMDHRDLAKNQYWPGGYGYKFAAWWVLQHIKGYQPFRTDIRTVFKIKGNLNK